MNADNNTSYCLCVRGRTLGDSCLPGRTPLSTRPRFFPAGHQVPRPGTPSPTAACAPRPAGLRICRATSWLRGPSLAISSPNTTHRYKPYRTNPFPRPNPHRLSRLPPLPTNPPPTTPNPPPARRSAPNYRTNPFPHPKPPSPQPLASPLNEPAAGHPKPASPPVRTKLPNEPISPT